MQQTAISINIPKKLFDRSYPTCNGETSIEARGSTTSCQPMRQPMLVAVLLSFMEFLMTK